MRIVRHSANEEVRNMAVLCLGQLCDKRAETLVCNLLARAESEATRSYAAQALSRLSHSEQSFQAVLKALSDVHALVRWTAAAALGSIGDRRAVGPLRSALSDREVIPTLPAEETVAEAAKRALDQFLRADAGAPKGVHKRAAETERTSGGPGDLAFGACPGFIRSLSSSCPAFFRALFGGRLKR
jgi:HEAT repeat protein